MPDPVTPEKATPPAPAAAEPEKVPASNDPAIHTPGEPQAFVHPLDLLDVGSTAKMAELEKSILTPALDPLPPPAEAPPEPAKEEIVAAEPAKEQPPVAAAPETPPPAPTPERPKRWKQLREAQRATKAAEAKAQEEATRRAEIEAQLAVARQPPADPYADPELDDPLTKVNKELETVKKSLAEQAEQNKQNDLYRQQEQARSQVLRDEDVFRATKPDYNKALDYLVESRRQEYDDMGLIDLGAEQWIAQNEEVVKRHAAETGKDPTDDDQLYEAAREISFGVLIDRDRQALLAGSKALGKTVPERVYALATRRGYAAAQAPAPVASPTAAADQAQERVRAAVAAQAVTTSLSALQTNAAPRNKEIKTRDDVLKLSEKEIAELDQKQPGWDRMIFGG